MRLIPQNSQKRRESLHSVPHKLRQHLLLRHLRSRKAGPILDTQPLQLVLSLERHILEFSIRLRVPLQLRQGLRHPRPRRRLAALGMDIRGSHGVRVRGKPGDGEHGGDVLGEDGGEDDV